jgi:hypothetical protein
VTLCNAKQNVYDATSFDVSLSNWRGKPQTEIEVHFDFVIGRFSAMILTRSTYSPEFREFKSTADNLNMPLSLVFTR